MANSSYFTGDIIKTIFFDEPTITTKFEDALTTWLVTDVGHKLDIGDIATLQKRYAELGITMQIKLNPNDRGA